MFPHPALDRGVPWGPRERGFKGEEERGFSLQLSEPAAASLGKRINLEAILLPQKVGYRNVGGDNNRFVYLPRPSSLLFSSGPQETFT